MMRFDKEKFLKETDGSLGAAFKVIDALFDVINEYIAADDVSNENGFDCFCYPEQEVKTMMKDNQIDKFIVY